MEGKKFSSSKRVVIYVRDVLERYQPDALRYFICAAGPENQDSDFTWSEFVRRTNDELVAGWGNLVNRTATLVAKNFGEIPAVGELSDEDAALLDQVESSFTTVGELIGRHRQKQADRRGDADRRRGEPLRHRPGAVAAQERRPARAAGHRPARDGAVRGRLQPAAGAVPPAQRQRRRPRPRWCRRRSRRCRASTTSRTSTAARATRSSPATTRPHRRGGATRSPRAPRSTSRRRCSPSSTRDRRRRAGPAHRRWLTRCTRSRVRPSSPSRARRRSSRRASTSRSRVGLPASRRCQSLGSRWRRSTTSTPTVSRSASTARTARGPACSCTCTAAASSSTTSTCTTTSPAGWRVGAGWPC